MSNTLMRDTVEGTVIAVVDDLIQDWGLDIDGGLSGASTLVADLQFASVDIIQLCVALEQAYDRKFGFQDLLMKDGSYVGDLSLAQFAAFMAPKLNA